MGGCVDKRAASDWIVVSYRSSHWLKTPTNKTSPIQKYSHLLAQTFSNKLENFFLAVLKSMKKDKDESHQALDFLCSTEPTNQALFRNGTECIVTCANGLKPTDAVVHCSCYR